MSERKRPSANRATTFRVGGKVMVRMGPTPRQAEIVEDRGPIGIGGRRILRVRYVDLMGETQPTFEVPLDYVTVVKERNGRRSGAKLKSRGG